MENSCGVRTQILGAPFPLVLHGQDSSLYLQSCPITCWVRVTPKPPTSLSALLTMHHPSPKPGTPCRVGVKSPWRPIRVFTPILMGWLGLGGIVPLGFGVAGPAVISLSFPACCSYEAGILENPKVMDHSHRAGVSRVFAA